MEVSGQAAAPPAVLKLVAHPLRWRLLSELAGSDYRVRELVNRIDEPQNLISYHLRLLRDGGLVTATRSTFDGRDSYYHLDLDRCAHALADAGGALHPALRPHATLPTRPSGRQPRPPIGVLFICTGNSARSPIAEALLRHHATDQVNVTSAGTRPKPRLHPNSVRVLRDQFGIDIADQRPRAVDSLTGRRFDYVITLCDKARENCPDFTHHPRRAHWSIPDPAAAGDADQTSYPAFHHITGEIHTRVRHLLTALTHTTGGSAMTDQYVSVRYLVDDVQQAIDFYTTHLGFTLNTSAAPAFADVTRGPLRLLLSGPASSGARATPADAATAGHNRIHLILDDLAAEIDRLRAAGVTFRSDLISGPGGQQILLADPAGNLIELFQPADRPGTLTHPTP